MIKADRFQPGGRREFDIVWVDPYEYIFQTRVCGSCARPGLVRWRKDSSNMPWYCKSCRTGPPKAIP